MRGRERKKYKETDEENNENLMFKERRGKKFER